MRFFDAIGELDTVTGFQVHRSHWVAPEAISQVEQDRKRMFLRLDCGRRVPVSRADHPVMKAQDCLGPAATARSASATDEASGRAVLPAPWGP
ncbi:MAG: LytTR family transcriptional regulator [Rhodobacteraceae bacterium]|nr:LytTR family transcriptional regulator [Paracoccaceae bacterium]